MQFTLNYFFYWMCRNCNSKQKWHGKQNMRIYIYIYKRKKHTIGLCGEILLYEQSHLIKGLWFWSSKLVESMAAPLHGSPLIFHWFEFAEIPHFWNIVFSAITAIIFTIKHHCDQSNIHPPKFPPFKSIILFKKKKKRVKFIKLL